MRRSVICGACLFLLLSSGCRRASAPRDANILLITLDTTRADHLGGAKTPHLDALSARGVLFTHAMAQAPLTLPSHASIMTGAYPPRHGLRDMEGFVLDKSHPTLASITHGSGFATAAFVGARVLAKTFGLANGFTIYDDDIGNGRGDDDLPDAVAERRAAIVTEHALEWIKQNGKKKF